MSAWVLAKDLEGLAARAADADLQKLCRRIQDNYQYPVDTVLLSPDLEVLGHMNVEDAMHQGPSGYRLLLRRALGEAVAGEEDTTLAAGLSKDSKRILKLTLEEPSGSLLDVLAAGDPIAPQEMLFSIDLTAFEEGGQLEIEVRVGRSEASARFQLLELHHHDEGLALATVDALGEIAPRGSGRLEHGFTRGKVLYLSATRRGDSPKDSTNAFHATVVVRPR